MLVRRLPPDDTFVAGGKIQVPEHLRKEQSENFYKGIVITMGEPRYLAHKKNILMKEWPVKKGDEIIFKSHGGAGVLDAGFNCSDGFEYIIVMYHEILAVIE